MADTQDGIRKLFVFTPAEIQALQGLAQAGYAFPQASEVGVIRKALRLAWEAQFPGVAFPDPQPVAA